MNYSQEMKSRFAFIVLKIANWSSVIFLCQVNKLCMTELAVLVRQGVLKQTKKRWPVSLESCFPVNIYS